MGKRVSIRAIVQISVVVIFVLVAVQAYVGWQRLGQLQEEAGQLANRHYPAARAIEKLRTHVIQVQQWLTDISATRGLDGLDKGFEKAAHHAREFRAELERLRQLLPRYEEEYRALEEAFALYYASGEKMARRYIEQGPLGGNALMAGFDQAAERLSGRLDPLMERLEREVEAAERALQESVAGGRGAITAYSAVLLLVVVAVAWVMVRFVVRPIDAMVQEARRQATSDARGDWRLDESGMGETGQLSHWINRFIEKRQQEMARLNSVAEQLARTATDLQTAADTSRDVMALQRQKTDQVDEVIERLVGRVDEVTRDAARALDAARTAEQASNTGMAEVRHSLASINELAASVEEAGEVILSVEKKSEGIGHVSEVIHDIAEQTNLLALNAAIEAARAGDQGRGFAVVADEVRNLAQRTQTSTKEIQSIIESLQSEARQAVEVMRQGRERAATCLDRSTNASEVLEAITRDVASIRQMNGRIADAAQEQRAATGEISEGMAVIHQVARQAADESATLAAIGDRLVETSREMKGLLARIVR